MIISNNKVTLIALPCCVKGHDLIIANIGYIFTLLLEILNADKHLNFLALFPLIILKETKESSFSFEL